MVASVPKGPLAPTLGTSALEIRSCNFWVEANKDSNTCQLDITPVEVLISKQLQRNTHHLVTVGST